MKIDARISADWKHSIERVYGVLKKKTMPEILNRSAGSVAVKAGMNVRAGRRGKIVRYFSQRARSRGGGADDVFPGSIAYAIYRAKFQRLGRLADGVVDEWVGRKIGTANILRLGFFAAAGAFAAWMKRRGRLRPRRGLGWGVPAKPSSGWQCEASLHHAVPVKNKGQATAIVQSAAERAIAKETAQLRAQAERLLARDIRAVSSALMK